MFLLYSAVTVRFLAVLQEEVEEGILLISDHQKIMIKASNQNVSHLFEFRIAISSKISELFS